MCRAVWRRLSAAVWTRRGRRRLARGDVAGAMAALEGAVRRRPDAFPALLLLARAHLRVRDLVRAHRLLARAQEADLKRFRRDAARGVAEEGFLLEDITQPRPPREPHPAAALRRPREAGASLAYGDCRDLDEYARFRAMPPITRAEVETVDWDDVLSDLLDD